MPSLRKRVSSYFRQLSFHNEPREKRHNLIENTFINKYLQGEIKLKEGPPIIYGKNPTDLPNYEIGTYRTGPNIIGCYTGPNGGLTTVKRSEKHLSVQDQDIDFIDTADEVPIEPTKPAQPVRSPNRNSDQPLDNTTMLIKVAGQEYFVTNRKKRSHNKSHSLGSLSDFKIEIDKTKIINNNNVGDAVDDKAPDSLNGVLSHKSEERCDRLCDNVQEGESGEKDSFALGKSKSEGNPFGHKKRGKITRLQQRPTADDATDASKANSGSSSDANLPPDWNLKSEQVFGISDSLYDKNLISKTKNGDPIADCFGVIARCDSAILAVADGVNWGEKASIAAKSAIHGCLHYLNKTVFLDTKPFDNLIKDGEGVAKSDTPIHETRICNTREIFVCLLRAFNCAHDLILENKGMLTTLTVAIVLPLKQNGGDHVDNYICCVCNVGDTLAYVYSQKHGVRELTKGSHDINCNRDMRDALGALGPVDGINPDLSNLTLSITTIQKGDIVLVASDGLTDNFDPNVCKFTVTSDVAKKKQATPQSSIKARNPAAPAPKQNVPTKPPRRNYSRSSKERSTSIESNKSTKSKTPSTSKTPSAEVDNPLVAQFMRENSLDENTAASQAPAPRPSHKPVKPVQRTHSERAQKITPAPKPEPSRTGFLRSKTSLELRKTTISRNPDGIPFATPVQRYELTLLLIEDILKRGISGKENQCVTAKKLCENLVSFTISITNAKRRTLEDNDLYFSNQNGVLVELSHQEKKMRRKRGLEKVQNLPGKLDHVTVVAYNVGNI